MIAHFSDQVSPLWGELHRRCRGLLQREESLREVAEIVGVEGLQDADRLLMHVTERIRMEFLVQNAYTEDAFSPPEATMARISELLAFFDRAEAGLKEGAYLDELLKNESP
jgi:V/A-type H+-transporting ATPase subunit A